MEHLSRLSSLRSWWAQFFSSLELTPSSLWLGFHLSSASFTSLDRKYTSYTCQIECNNLGDYINIQVNQVLCEKLNAVLVSSYVLHGRCSTFNVGNMIDPSYWLCYVACHFLYYFLFLVCIVSALGVMVDSLHVWTSLID